MIEKTIKMVLQFLDFIHCGAQIGNAEISETAGALADQLRHDLESEDNDAET